MFIDANQHPLSRRRSYELPEPKFIPTSSYAGIERRGREQLEAKKDSPQADFSLDISSVDGLSSSSSLATSSTTTRRSSMTLSLKGLSKNGKTAFYSGAATTIRIGVAAFEGKTAPQSIDVPDGVFAAPKQPKVKLTAEQRKEARANKPKPTLAEQIERREKALAKMREKLTEGAAAI